MRRILVLRGGALGDFIVTLPALALLRKRWPAARIELVGNASAAQLAQARGLLDAVHSQHKARWSAFFNSEPLPKPLGAWLADFDLVLNYWPDPDGEIRRRFPLRPEQVFLEAAAMPTQGPAAAHYCAPLAQLGLSTEQFWFPLSPLVSPQGEPGIIVHPGSGSPRKNWPDDRWRTFIEQLSSPVTLVLGEAEEQRWSAFVHAQPDRVTALIQRPLEELVAQFSCCRLFLGHDSGISHLAAAAHAPAVLLFGPTEASVWAPPAPNVRVLHGHSGLSSIAMEDVRRAAAEVLSDRR